VKNQLPLNKLRQKLLIILQVYNSENVLQRHNFHSTVLSGFLDTIYGFLELSWSFSSQMSLLTLCSTHILVYANLDELATVTIVNSTTVT